MNTAANWHMCNREFVDICS